MNQKPLLYFIAFACFFLLSILPCERDLQPLPESQRSTYLKVAPNFICNSQECIVNIYYKIDDQSSHLVSTVLSVTGPNGVQSILERVPPTNDIIERDKPVPGDDSSVWTAGPGIYVFSLLVIGESIGEGGELVLSREVVLFEDSHSIPHSAAITVTPENQTGVKDLVEMGTVQAEAGKVATLYQVCNKGVAITGISYDEALSVFQTNNDYPKKLEIKGWYENGNNLFSHSINPGDSLELSPIELSETVIIETTALPGQMPYPQDETVRWKLSFQLGCLVSN